MSNLTKDSNALLTPHVGHGTSKKYNNGQPIPSVLVNTIKKIITEKYTMCAFAVCFI